MGNTRNSKEVGLYTETQPHKLGLQFSKFSCYCSSSLSPAGEKGRDAREGEAKGFKQDSVRGSGRGERVELFRQPAGLVRGETRTLEGCIISLATSKTQVSGNA